MGQAGLGSFAYIGRHASKRAPSIASRLYLAVELGEACQLKCRHCIYHRERPAEARPPDFVLERIRSAFRRGFDPFWVSFAGKEPTLFPRQLVELAGLTKRPARVNILMTNGLLLSGALLSDLAPLIDYFDISLDGDEAAHDWMRGAGTFRRTWQNIEHALRHPEPNIGIIATAVRAELQNSKPQYESLLALARRLSTEFGVNERLSLTISLYFGDPNDPMLLGSEEIARLITGLTEISFPTRVLFTANYAHLWPGVRRRLGWDHVEIEYDSTTGYPFLRRGHIQAILFNLTQTYQLSLRMSNEGKLFLGCNHLVLGDRASELSVADLSNEELDSAAERVWQDKIPIMNSLAFVPSDCLSCSHWESCRGGDRLSGLYFDGLPADPYCDLVRRAA